MKSREATPENPHRAQAEFLGQAQNFRLRLFDHVAAGFHVLLFGEPFTPGPDATAEPVTRFDNHHLGAATLKLARRDKTGETCTGNQH
jgi:hypothetical protein